MQRMLSGEYMKLIMLIVLSSLSLHAMQQMDESDIKELGMLPNQIGYWAKLNDNSLLVVTNAQDKITCIRGFENGGIWQKEEQPFPDWWFNKLGALYKNQQDMELMIEKLNAW